jgi:hypothetical protein
MSARRACRRLPTRGGESVDLQWLPGCQVAAAAEDMAEADGGDPWKLQCYESTDIHVGFSEAGGAAYDCIALRGPRRGRGPAATRLFRTSLESSRLHGGTFTMPVLTLLRRFAKKRHVYGSKFGFPGGSAWSSMLWVRAEHGWCPARGCLLSVAGLADRQRRDDPHRRAAQLPVRHRAVAVAPSVDRGQYGRHSASQTTGRNRMVSMSYGGPANMPK